eukprot:TRINITY_DN14233_c0_g1_i2.p2 TRINITY_DN14233_c0_g1~~TRINITY_DN14233_c0_g1_i2.p2  ORF type:complete len:115 (-),score=33.11 TRINITY_DN14233_c0_g1_i2:5-349(-)
MVHAPLAGQLMVDWLQALVSLQVKVQSPVLGQVSANIAQLLAALHEVMQLYEESQVAAQLEQAVLLEHNNASFAEEEKVTDDEQPVMSAAAKYTHVSTTTTVRGMPHPNKVQKL